MSVHQKVNTFIHLGGEKHCESKMSGPKDNAKFPPGLEPCPVDPEGNALIMRSPCHHYGPSAATSVHKRLFCQCGSEQAWSKRDYCATENIKK